MHKHHKIISLTLLICIPHSTFNLYSEYFVDKVLTATQHSDLYHQTLKSCCTLCGKATNKKYCNCHVKKNTGRAHSGNTN